MSKVLKVFVITAAVILGFSQVSRAEDEKKTFGEIYTECGLGAMLFQHEKWAGLAAVSNIIWDFGTTASSSALTTPESCIGGKEEKLAAFIYHSYDALESDLAKGHGQHLDTLMILAGKNQSDEKAIQSLRQDLAAMVAQGDYAAKDQYQKAASLFGLVQKNTSKS